MVNAPYDPHRIHGARVHYTFHQGSVLCLPSHTLQPRACVGQKNSESAGHCSPRPRPCSPMHSASVVFSGVLRSPSEESAVRASVPGALWSSAGGLVAAPAAQPAEPPQHALARHSMTQPFNAGTIQAHDPRTVMILRPPPGERISTAAAPPTSLAGAAPIAAAHVHIQPQRRAMRGGQGRNRGGAGCFEWSGSECAAVSIGGASLRLAPIAWPQRRSPPGSRLPRSFIVCACSVRGQRRVSLRILRVERIPVHAIRGCGPVAAHASASAWGVGPRCGQHGIHGPSCDAHASGQQHG